MKVNLRWFQNQVHAERTLLPIFSTTSSVSLMPAVSRSVTGTPHTVTLASTTSRVVPAMSVTIALSVYTLKTKHGFTMVL